MRNKYQRTLYLFEKDWRKKRHYYQYSENNSYFTFNIINLDVNGD